VSRRASRSEARRKRFREIATTTSVRSSHTRHSANCKGRVRIQCDCRVRVNLRRSDHSAAGPLYLQLRTTPNETCWAPPNSTHAGSTDYLANATSVNHAANLIRESAESRAPSEPIVIIDEIDRIASHDAKPQFAELIKVMHDMRLPLRLVMCGIGKTLDEIIGSHLSASRAITGFELPPITYDARWAIVTNAASKLDHF
jgi:hypothetical protein